jgi:hypothetical protein
MECEVKALVLKAVTRVGIALYCIVGNFFLVVDWNDISVRNVHATD